MHTLIFECAETWHRLEIYYYSVNIVDMKIKQNELGKDNSIILFLLLVSLHMKKTDAVILFNVVSDFEHLDSKIIYFYSVTFGGLVSSTIT